MTQHILLISTEGNVNHLVQAALQELNTSIDMVDSMKEALALAKEKTYALIIFNKFTKDGSSTTFMQILRHDLGQYLSLIWLNETFLLVTPAKVRSKSDDPRGKRPEIPGGHMQSLTAQNLKTVVQFELAQAALYSSVKGLDEELIEQSAPGPRPIPTITPSQIDTPIEEHVLLRLDTAVPESVQVDTAFDLAVAIRQMDSPLLNEAGLTQIDSGEVQVEWPANQPAVRLILEVSAPDCVIQGAARRPFRLRRGQDSPNFFFHLTPKKSGTLSIIVTVYQEIDWLGSARVSTTAVAQLAGEVTTQIISQALTTNHLGRLHSNLMNAFSMDELNTICLELGVNPQQIDGHARTLAAFANGIILYCVEQNKMEKLIAICTHKRNHIYWQLDKVPV